MSGARWTQVLGEALLVLIPLILSLSIHECAHAWAARRLGDATAQALGRLTLNPLAHIDPVGTVALPLAMLALSGAAPHTTKLLPLLGWARPTPVNAGNFSRSISVRRGIMVVAAAGPLSNLAVGVVCAALMRVVAQLQPTLGQPLLSFLGTMLVLNSGLFVFNLLPVAPLDGHKVVSGLLPPAQAVAFDRFNQRFGSWLLLAVVLLFRDVVRVPVEWTYQGLLALVGLR